MSRRPLNLFVELFLSLTASPRQIVLDLDVTDDQVHGHQEQAFFNKYYGGVSMPALFVQEASGSQATACQC